MTSKEALEELKTFIGFIRQEGFYEQAYKCIEILEDKIKSLQERLETLEIENEQLKGNENIVSNYAYSLRKENEKLKNENKELWEYIETYNHKFAEVERKKADLIKETDKFKKAIQTELEVLRERRETFWFTDSYDEYAVVNEIIEEFEEVLGNAT